MKTVRITHILAAIERRPFQDELKLAARIDGIHVFEKVIPMPPIDDITPAFDQIFAIAQDGLKAAIQEAKEKGLL